jgi:hypothetical protein
VGKGRRGSIDLLFGGVIFGNLAVRMKGVVQF